MKKYCLFLLQILLSFSVTGQNSTTDSLISLLKSTSDYSTRIQLLKLLADRQNDAPSIIKYANEGIVLTKRLNRPGDQLNFIMELSTAYFKNYNYPEYLKSCFEGLDLSRNLRDYEASIRFLNGITLGYHSGGEDHKAINYRLEGLNLAERYQNKKAISSLCGNIAICYMSLRLADSALYYDMESYQVAKNTNNPAIVYSLMNLAEAEDSLNRKGLALSHLKQALDLIKNDDPFRDRNLMNVYAGMARINEQIGKPDSAIFYADKGYRLAVRNNDLELIYETSVLLSELNENKNARESLKYYKIAVNAKDSIFNTEKAKQFQTIIANEQDKEAEIIKERELQAEERRENLQLSGIALFIPLFMLSVLLLSRTKTHWRIIEFMSILSLLLIFEFVTLLAHPYIENVTHHKPVLEYLILVVMASMLVPLHHYLTHWLKAKLLHAHIQIQSKNSGEKDSETDTING